MTPSQKYNDYLQQSAFYPDSAQQHSIYLLDRLQEKLRLWNQQKTSISTKLSRLFGKNCQTLQGLYFWGGVGRGKTFLMDIFFETLPLKKKKRVHFHHFMQQIHAELGHAEAGKDPVIAIAREFSRDTEVLCLDEFVVTDIGDAMLIGRLLQALFAEDVILITTSNVPPEELYKEGLQRARFLPAIDLLLQHCQVVNLDGGQDYRMLGLQQTHLYRVPHDPEAERAIQAYLNTHLINGHGQGSLRVNGRDIRYRYRAEDTIWFQFDELCKTARSRFDYLEIAREFHTLVLSDIQKMTDLGGDVTRRFISLIDVLYDHRVKLICTAAAPIEQLYEQEFLAFEFQRTISRLREMQTEDYLARSHIS